MPPKLVALGGGHGLAVSLQALRGLSDDLTAIVVVSDDGGSSGRLRREMGILPPGDLRMALSALCEETEWGHLWRDVLQTRFATPGALDGHALGNLLLAAVWEKTGDVVAGLEWVGKLLNAHGRVLPLAAEPIEISGKVAVGTRTTALSGQVALATAGGRITEIAITPTNPQVPDATVAAISEADLVVLGPGSWYTSVLVHFLVPEVRQALIAAQEKTVLTLNIAYEDPETAEQDRIDDLRALVQVAPEFCPRLVISDLAHGKDPELARWLAERNIGLLTSELQQTGAVDRHDPLALRRQYAAALDYTAPHKNSN